MRYMVIYNDLKGFHIFKVFLFLTNDFFSRFSCSLSLLEITVRLKKQPINIF